MDYEGFPVAARGMESKHGRRRFKEVNWQKQAGLLQQIMYFQSRSARFKFGLSVQCKWLVLEV